MYNISTPGAEGAARRGTCLERSSLQMLGKTRVRAPRRSDRDCAQEVPKFAAFCPRADPHC